MSWDFGGLSSATPAGGAQANAAVDLEAIETEQLGFQALSGDRKVQLLQQSWPANSPPSKTASLLSIAPNHGLLAAAGPDSLLLYETDDIRAAFSRGGSGNIDDLQPRQRSSIPRISHLAFSSDEQALVITAESGGGLAVYDVNAGLTGSQWTHGIQIPTSGISVRHLLPNPNKDSSHLFAIVLTDGKLVIADLKEQKLVMGASGSSVLREGVSCASWSKMGKQIVAGLADGTAVQLDVQGNQKEQIPRPPGTALSMTAIYWLENQDFLTIHAPVMPQTDADSMMPADALYHLVHRDKNTKTCSFHRFAVDPCPPFLDERLPAHHFIQRIRDWQPNLDDSLIIACTASTDIGVLTRSKVPLSQSLPADKITHIYTTTSFMDTRRAALPMGVDGSTDTFPIGVALDLSSKQKVAKPIPTDESIDESSTALPQLCVLNQEGYLSAWWYVYNEAVREQKPAPGLVFESTTQLQSQQVSQPMSSGFGSSSFGANTQQPVQPSQPTSSTFGSNPSPFGASTQQAATPSTSSFGQPSAAGFGKPSFGQASSVWGGNTGGSFGKPSFGSPSQVGVPTGSAFGQSGGLGGNKASVWGTDPSKTGSTFGQPSGVGSNTATTSPFASFAQNNTNTSPFAAKNNTSTSPFAPQTKPYSSPFAAFAKTQNNEKLSPFAAAKPNIPNEPSFGSTVTLSSNNTSSFGSGATFGAGTPFGKTAAAKEDAMDDTESPREEKQEPTLGSVGGFKLGSTFKPDDSAKDEPAVSKEVSSSLFGIGFGKALGDAAKEKSADIPIVKEEPDETRGPSLKDIPEAAASSATTGDAPLPPDFLSQQSQKSTEDAPLPPDFLSQNKLAVTDDAPLPPDFTTASQDMPLPTTEDAASLPGEDDESSLVDDDDDPENADGNEPESDEDEEDWDDEESEDEGEVESAEDDDDDDGDEESRVIKDPVGLSAFEARLGPASPKKTEREQESTTPETVQKPSFTPAGFPKAPLNFAPTRKMEESPRSPSPVRAVTSPMHFDHERAKPPTFKQSGMPTLQKKQKATAKSSQSKEPPSEESLEDENDRAIKQILEAPIEPNKDLPDFIAHQDYNGTSQKDGIAGQLERVYHDVNSMIDTLGLNARALQAFVAGHSSQERAKTLNEDDLEDEDAWVLCELSTLERLQTRIGDRLDSGRITEVREKVVDIMEQDEQMSRITAKTTELRKQISLRTDPESKAQQQAAPLPQAWASQQIELRQSLRDVQKLLTEVEDSISLLRADLASVSAGSSDSNGITGVPTLEAVTNTILKMTAMIETKSGDIDVLESQMRRLPGDIASLGVDYEAELNESFAGSRISNGNAADSTPPRKGRSALGMSGMLGLRFKTPPSASFRSSVVFDPSGSAFGRSTASVGSARKKMSDVTTEEVELWKDKAGRRRNVLRALRQAVENAGGTRLMKAEQSS